MLRRRPVLLSGPAHAAPATVHAAAAAIAFVAGISAVTAHAGTRIVLHSAIAADQAVVAIAAAIRPVFHAATATDQAVIAVATTVGLVLHAAASADQTVVTITTTIWLEAVGVIRMRSVRPSMRAGTPRVIIVVVAAVPASVTDVSVVIEDDGATASASPSTAPADTPPAPSPRMSTAEASKTTADSYANPNAESKRKSRAHIRYRRRSVIGHDVWRSVNHRRVVLRDVNDLRIGGLNHDGLWRRLRYLNLRSGFEGARGLRFLPHDLHCGHHVRLLIVKCLPQTRCPCQIFRHVIEHIRKLYERFHAVIPSLLIHGGAQGASGERFVLLHPVIGNRHLVGKGRSGQDLCHQIVGVERDGSDQSIQLI